MRNPFLAAAEDWPVILALLLAPISWLAELQGQIVEFLFRSPGWVVVLKVVFLLLPALLFLAGLWSTTVSLYTLVFRSKRRRFAAAIFTAWWDAARMVWGYWVGLARFAYVASGWLLTLSRLAGRFVLETLWRAFAFPLVCASRLAGRYSRPGLPWIALAALLGWASLEATAFTHILYPSVWEILETVVGVHPPGSTAPVLCLLLALVVLGSFACLDALRDAIERRRTGAIAVRVAVQLAVTGFEVAVLYRQAVEVFLPRLGTTWALTVAAVGWVAVRGGGWSLFGKFGVRPMSAVIARRSPSAADEPRATSTEDGSGDARSFPEWDAREELGWLLSKSRQEAESLTLPVVQLLAAGLNFAIILLTSRPLLSLPLKDLESVKSGRELLAGLDPDSAGNVSRVVARGDSDSGPRRWQSWATGSRG